MFRLPVVFALLVCWHALPAAAQSQDAAQPQAADLPALLLSWQQTQDVEEKIALGERLVALGDKGTPWPPDVDPLATMGDIRLGLGSSFLMRAAGVRAENLEAAIAHLEAALALWRRKAEPENVAITHNNLGMAYWARINGQPPDNQETAAAHFEAALTVFSRKGHPMQWAQLQNNLAVVYWNRTRGARADNLDKAIQHFEAALTVFTRNDHPQQWAAAQNNLGSAYRSRNTGDRADNREKAISYLEAALTIFTREAFPHEWGQAQNNLGICYLDRIQGDQSANREKAIAAFEAALTLLTRDRYPHEWAHAHHNLGIAYAARSTGDRAGNRRKSIAAFEAALHVFNRDVDPRQHLRTSRLLARTLAEDGAWQSAAPHFASAREAFLLLFGEGLDEVDTRALIADAGPMFSEGAFTAIQLGEPDAALEIAAAGRARLLAVALKLQTLDVDAASRKRIDDLRGSIRAAQQRVESARGLERAGAIEKLVELRQELLGLVKAGKSDRGTSETAVAKARKAITGGGALVVPVISTLGATILVVSGPPEQETVQVVSLPNDTGERLFTLLRGPRDDPRLTGWLGAYFITQLQDDELNRRWPEWLAAVDNLGADLWDLFGARLDAALRAKGMKQGARLVFLPPGELAILPLGLVQNRSTKRRLIDDYEIVYAPTLDTLAAAQNLEARAPTVALVINPTGDLPGTEQEGKLVASYFPVKARTVLEGNNATVERVLTALKDRTHWHFASHGTFSWQDARQSGLIMKGGQRLSVSRLLETEGLGRPRLVVLSACETGLYDLASNPDEFIGLPGAFAALGATGVVGTLWPVSDAATALLIAKFYELYLDMKLPPPTALHRAQAWIRDATSGRLNTYADAIARKGLLQSSQLEELKKDLHARALAPSHNRSVASPDRAASRAAAKGAARPYSHPYFWAGFTYTGL